VFAVAPLASVPLAAIVRGGVDAVHGAARFRPEDGSEGP
jgi:hypothetical protein